MRRCNPRTVQRSQTPSKSKPTSDSAGISKEAKGVRSSAEPESKSVKSFREAWSSEPTKPKKNERAEEGAGQSAASETSQVKPSESTQARPSEATKGEPEEKKMDMKDMPRILKAGGRVAGAVSDAATGAKARFPKGSTPNKVFSRVERDVARLKAGLNLADGSVGDAAGQVGKAISNKPSSSALKALQGGARLTKLTTDSLGLAGGALTAYEGVRKGNYIQALQGGVETLKGVEDVGKAGAALGRTSAANLVQKAAFNSPFGPAISRAGSSIASSALGQGVANIAKAGITKRTLAALGPLGIGLDGLNDVVSGSGLTGKPRNWEKLGVGAAKGAAAALSAFPPTAAAGALLYGGALVYEHRDTFAKYGGKALNAVTAGARALFPHPQIRPNAIPTIM